MHPHEDVTRNCNKHPSLKNGYPGVSGSQSAWWLELPTVESINAGRTGDEMKTLSPTAQYLSHYEQNTSAHKKSPQKRAFLAMHGIHSNRELLAVLVLNPLGRLATARPGFACRGVAVLGRHLGASAGAAGTASGEYILRSQTKFSHQRAHLADGITQFAPAGFTDLLLQSLALLQ
jgi:hypothetical protein